MEFPTDARLGDIMVRFPGAGEIFKRRRIDYCCGGERTIAVAASEQGSDAEELAAELNSAYADARHLAEEPIRWAQETSERLIGHIVNAHHAYLQQTLPELSQLTTKILRVHGAHHGDMLRKVHRYLHVLKMDMEQHMIKEEEVIFPLIVRYEQEPTETLRADASQAIEELEREHAEAGDLLRQIREATLDFQLPVDACATFARTYEKLEELEADMFQHVHLENNILFERLNASTLT